MRRALGCIIAAGLVVAAIAIPVAPALAADGATVTIGPATQTRPSGSDFVSTIGFGCSALAGDVTPCEDVTIRVPLAGLAAVPFTDAEIAAMIGFPAPTPVQGWSVVGGELVIELGELAAGSSGSFPLVVTPPNHITPNGTTWEMTPVISGAGIPDATSPTTATNTATATLTPQISKTVVGSGFRHPGDTVEYDITVQCTQTSAGNILAASMTVTDTLPAGLVFDSAVPAPVDPSAAPLSWNLSPLPPSCTTPGASGTATIHVVAHLDDPLDGVDQLRNVAGVTATTTDGQDIPEKTNDAIVTVLHDTAPGIGSFRKDSFAQLRDAGSDETQTEANSHTTYPGAWGPDFATQDADVLARYLPNQDSGMLQSGYKMQYDSGVAQGSGAQIGVVDPVPCLDPSGVYHRSNAPGDLCQTPAFIPTIVSVWSSSAGIDPFDAAAYRPQARLADGSVVDLTHVGLDGRNASSYRVPSGLASPVAELVFPGDPGLSGQIVRWAIFGHVAAAVDSLDVVQNTGHATVSWQGDVIGTAEQSAEIYVINEPQTGIDKNFVGQSGGNATLRLSARFGSPTAATEDLVVADLLPAGMTLTSQPATITADALVTLDGAQTQYLFPADSIEVIDNYLNSGRQLIRVTWLASTIGAHPGSIGLVTQAMDFGVQVPADVPAVYDNRAQVYYTSPDLSAQCQQDVSHTQETVEDIDYNGNGRLDDRHCFDADALRIVPAPGSASFISTKTVQGEDDAAPQSYPGIGTVGTDGGVAVFRVGWSNTGATSLHDAVTYDILPAVGDVGVGGSSAGVPRGSDFDAVLVAVTEVPAGVTVFYSTSGNPCRDEVFPDVANPGCVDDWSTTPPADLATVTALKAVGAGPYAFGEGYGFAIRMTVPAGIARGDVAWNSIAANAQLPDSSWMQPSAPPKVGITAEALPMLSKQLAPGFDASDLKPGDEVRYVLSIANPSAVAVDVDARDVLPVGLTFTSITPALDPPLLDYDSGTHAIVWDHYPVPPRTESSWTVTAVIDDGVVGDLRNVFTGPGTIIVTPPCEDDPDATCVTVEVPPGSIAVRKLVDGDAAASAPSTFEFHVVCTAGGQTVADATFTVAGGSTSAPVTVPVGSECTVTETDAAGASTPAPPQTATIGSSTPVVVTATNTFDAGYLTVSKTIAGIGAAPFGQVDFVFRVDCVLAGQQVLVGERVTVRGDAAGPAVSAPVGPLPVGAACTVTEVDDGGADAAPAPVTVHIVEGTTETPVTAEVENRFSAGTVLIEKTVTGTLAAGHEHDAFVVEVTCESRDPLGATTTLYAGRTTVTAGSPAPVLDAGGDPVLLPVGARCFASEVETGGADRVQIDHADYASGAVVTPGGLVEPQRLVIRAVNTFGDPLGATGTDDTRGLAGAALLAVLAGGVLLLLRRRASHR